MNYFRRCPRAARRHLGERWQLAAALWRWRVAPRSGTLRSAWPDLVVLEVPGRLALLDFRGADPWKSYRYMIGLRFLQIVQSHFQWSKG